MPYFVVFAVMYVLLLLVVILYAKLLEGERYERRAQIKQHTEEIKSPKATETIEGANCITWDAQTGEVLEEKIL